MKLQQNCSAELALPYLDYLLLKGRAEKAKPGDGTNELPSTRSGALQTVGKPDYQSRL
jgi:hypothetical protein